jgi:NADH/F420H2 dehydrogenase subunit C
VEGPYIAPLPPRFIVDLLKERFTGSILDSAEFRGEITIRVDRNAILDVARFLRDDPATSFDMLSVVTGIHYLERDHDYEVLYHLLSLTKNHRLRLSVKLREGETVASVTPVWPGASWPERETFDLVGVRFSGHPDLRRIIMPEDYQYHPLRKDFDVEGGPTGIRPQGPAASPGFRDMESV